MCITRGQKDGGHDADAFGHSLDTPVLGKSFLQTQTHQQMKGAVLRKVLVGGYVLINGRRVFVDEPAGSIVSLRRVSLDQANTGQQNRGDYELS